MAKGISVEGLAELNARLNLAVVRTRAAAEAAVRAEVEAVGDDAEAAAPERTGELRRGIRRESGGLEGSVAATARHSKFVEHGTSKAPAQPFMSPAAERSRRRWPARAGAMIKIALGGGK